MIWDCLGRGPGRSCEKNLVVDPWHPDDDDYKNTEMLFLVLFVANAPSKTLLDP
jgi:hypothetical protein